LKIAGLVMARSKPGASVNSSPLFDYAKGVKIALGFAAAGIIFRQTQIDGVLRGLAN
jgi:hypothetical protein